MKQTKKVKETKVKQLVSDEQAKTSQESVSLTAEEKKEIEAKRKEQEKKDAFVKEYVELVKKYGYGIGLDVNSTFRDPRVAVFKTNS